jgi:hypothetical protein
MGRFRGRNRNIRHTLDQHPRLRATRIYQIIRDRCYSGSVAQLRRTFARLRPLDGADGARTDPSAAAPDE